MTQGLKAFRKIQIGLESPHGDPVPATDQLAGVLTLKEDVTLHQPTEELGALSKVVRSIVTGKQAALKFDGDATFEQILYALLMGVKGNITPLAILPEGAVIFTSPDTYVSYLTEVIDQDITTHMDADALAASSFIYIGLSNPFKVIDVTMGTAKNSELATLTAEYSKGDAAWEAIVIVDGTVDGEATLAKSGKITFTPPTDPAWAKDTINEQELYWLRLKVDIPLSETVDIAEIRVSDEAYTWIFAPSIFASAVQDSFTIEYGDNVQVAEAEYCMASVITISGAPDEPLKLSIDIFGRQATVEGVSFTGSLGLPAGFEDVLFNKCKFYINDNWATIGDTLKANTLLEFTFKINTGLIAHKSADGTLYFSFHGEDLKQVELDMTIVMNDTVATAERAKWQSQTERAIRIEAEGSEIQTGYNKKLTLDIWAVYSDWDTLSEKDGLDTVVVKLVSVGDLTNDHEFAVSVVNKWSALPS